MTHQFKARKNDYVECANCGLRIKVGTASFASHRDEQCPNRAEFDRINISGPFEHPVSK